MMRALGGKRQLAPAGVLHGLLLAGGFAAGTAARLLAVTGRGLGGTTVKAGPR